MRPIDADALMDKLNGIWDCNDMTFTPVDGCCIDADCKSCRWRETIEYVKRLVRNQTTISSWHRVEEPPKIGVPVLVTYIGYNTGETRCDLLAAYDGIAWRYWDDDEMLDEVMVEITHWMPIVPAKEGNQ